MHEQLDARAAGVGEEVVVMRLSGGEDLHHAGEQPVGAARMSTGLAASHMESMRIIGAARASTSRTRSQRRPARSR